MSDTATTENSTDQVPEETQVSFTPDLSPDAVRDFITSLNVSEGVVNTFATLASTLVNIGSANRARNALRELQTGVREVAVQNPGGDTTKIWEPEYDELAAGAVQILTSIKDSAGSEDDLDPDNENGLAGKVYAIRSTVKVLGLPDELSFACDVMLDAVAHAMTVSKPSKVTQLRSTGSRGAIPGKLMAAFRQNPGQRFSLSDLNKLIPEHGTGALGAALNRMAASGQVRAVSGISSSGREALLYSAA